MNQNKISHIPAQFSMIPSLIELRLGQNNIDKIHESFGCYMPDIADDNVNLRQTTIGKDSVVNSRKSVEVEDLEESNIHLRDNNTNNRNNNNNNDNSSSSPTNKSKKRVNEINNLNMALTVPTPLSKTLKKLW